MKIEFVTRKRELPRICPRLPSIDDFFNALAFSLLIFPNFHFSTMLTSRLSGNPTFFFSFLKPDNRTE
jgi:hypothetical protein